MKRLPLIILLLLCGAGACDNLADITTPTIPTPAPDPVTPPQPDPPAPEPDPVPKPPAPDPEPTPDPEPPSSAEISPLDPMTLLAEWQPRFAGLGFRLEVGPSEPLPTIADPDQHRWPIALWQGSDHQLLAYYAVFASVQGSEEALATASNLIESYHLQAAQTAKNER